MVDIAMEAFNIASDLLVIVMAFGMLRAEDPEIARDQNKAEKLAI
jgi:small neutral amino acid transporter SnatA (MarC family)